MSTQPSPSKSGSSPAPAAEKYTPEDWVISELFFTSSAGSPISGLGSWSAFSTLEHDRKTTVEESPHHVTLVYQAGQDVYRVDVSKAQVHIKRMRRSKYEDRKAKQPGGR